MALTNRTAAGALIGLAGLAATCTNPNYRAEDMTNPMAVVRQFQSDRGFNDSGLLYLAGYTAAAAGLAGVAYNAMTGKARK